LGRFLVAVYHLQPDFAGAYRNRGNAYHTLGDTVRAQADFETAMQFETANLDGFPEQYMPK
jgi:hypothetical protein